MNVRVSRHLAQSAETFPPVASWRRRNAVGRSFLLATSDFVALFLSGLLAYTFWALPVRNQSPTLYLELLSLLPLFTLGYLQAGLYPGFGLGPVETLRRLSYVTGFGFLVLAAFAFALKLPHLYSRITFAIAVALSLFLVPLGRAAVTHFARRWTWWIEPVVVIGVGRRAQRTIRSLHRETHLGYRPAAVLSLPNHLAPSSIEGVPVVRSLDEAGALAGRGCRVALLETDGALDHAILDRLQRDFHHVVLLREHDDLPVEGLQVRNLGDLVGIELHERSAHAGQPRSEARN